MVNDYSDRLKVALGGDSPDRIKLLAKELGLTYNAVKKVVCGDSNFFSVPNHIKAARFLGVRSEWLALGEDPMRPSPAEDSADWRTLAMTVAAAHPHADAREQLLDFLDRVDAAAAELRQITARRVKAHTP